MKLKDVKTVSEMARPASAPCANCNRPKTGKDTPHVYYQGQYRCKGMPGKVYTPSGGAPEAPAAAPAGEETPVQAPAASSAPKHGVASAPIATPSTEPSNEEIRNKIGAWLKRHNVENFTIEDDLTINVDGAVRFDDLRMPKLPGPVKFGKVSGDFEIASTGIETLRGCPEEVGSDEMGDFMADHNEYSSLEGGPKKVAGSYSITRCKNLKSFEHIASHIGGRVLAQECSNIKSLQGVHKQIKFIGHDFDLKGTPIESHVLGLLMIKGLQSVVLDNDAVATIINKHLKTPDRNIHEAQEELIDAGLVAFARL